MDWQWRSTGLTAVLHTGLMTVLTEMADARSMNNAGFSGRQLLDDHLSSTKSEEEFSVPRLTGSVKYNRCYYYGRDCHRGFAWWAIFLIALGGFIVFTVLLFLLIARRIRMQRAYRQEVARIQANPDMQSRMPYQGPQGPQDQNYNYYQGQPAYYGQQPPPQQQPSEVTGYPTSANPEHGAGAYNPYPPTSAEGQTK